MHTGKGLGVLWAAGTVGIYTGLYGFSASDRTFVVLGVVLSAVALAAPVLWLATRWRNRPQRAYVAGNAEVRTVSPPPETGAYGRCALELVVIAPGLPTTEVRLRDPRVPVESWPDVGDVLPVVVDIEDPRLVRVQWAEFRKHEFPDPPPPAPDFDDDEGYGYGFRPPPFPDEELRGLDFDDVDVPGPRRVLPLEDEPTTLTARYLFPTERFRGEWMRHRVRPLTRYALTLGLAVAGEILVRQYVPGEYLPAARAGVAVLGGLTALHVIVAWFAGRFVLTNRRVMVISGVLRRRVSMVPLARVTDLRYEQSLPGRLLGYGDFIIEGMRLFSPVRRITALPMPNEIYLRVVEEMYEPGAVEARLRSVSDFDDPYPFGEDQRTG